MIGTILKGDWIITKKKNANTMSREIIISLGNFTLETAEEHLQKYKDDDPNSIYELALIVSN